MRIIFYGFFRQITQCESIVFKKRLKNVRSLIQELSARFGKQFCDLIIDNENNQIKNNVIILINGKNVMHLNGMETKIYENDEIKILPITVGG